MAAVRWHERTGANRPGQILGRLKRGAGRLVQTVLPGRAQQPGGGAFPAVNISDAGETLLISAEMPGILPGDVELLVDAESVTISGERKIEAPEGVNFQRKERLAGRFNRTVSLPSRIEPEGVSAFFRNGVLSMTLPKAKEVPSRQIGIAAE